MLMLFYWLNIPETEKKLSRLSADGEHTVRFDFLTGNAVTEKGEPEERTYVIRRSRGCRGKLPRKMTENGWQSVGGNRNNYAAYYPGKNDEKPSFAGYIKLLSIIKIVIFMPLCFILGRTLGLLGGISDGAEENESFFQVLAEYFSDKGQLGSFIAWLLVAALCIVLLVIFHRATKLYEKLDGSSIKMDFTLPSERLYSKEQEKQMLKNKTMKKVFKYGWFLSFDKAEEYVEEMERKGWNFYRFDKLALNFYFIKGEPRNVRFVVDYQDDVSESYLSMNIEDGWQLKFKSYTHTGGYIVWMKVYDGEAPEFYSDREFMIKRAGKTAVLYGAACIPFAAFFGFMLYLMLTELELSDSYGILLSVAIGALILEYVALALLNILSYLRTKKKFK